MLEPPKATTLDDDAKTARGQILTQDKIFGCRLIVTLDHSLTPHLSTQKHQHTAIRLT